MTEDDAHVEADTTDDMADAGAEAFFLLELPRVARFLEVSFAAASFAAASFSIWAFATDLPVARLEGISND